MLSSCGDSKTSMKEKIMTNTAMLKQAGSQFTSVSVADTKTEGRDTDYHHCCKKELCG